MRRGGPVQLSIAPFFVGINDTLRSKAFPDGTMFSGRTSSPATLGHVVNFYNEPFTFNLSAEEKQDLVAFPRSL